jgi:hypothetical protein
MKELTPSMLIAVFEEIFGPWLFWALVAVAALIGAAFLYVVIRDRTLKSRDFLRAELWAPVGAIAAILFVQFMTNSRFRDVGGPIDVIMLITIGLAGAVGLTIFAYVVLELLWPAGDEGRD